MDIERIEHREAGKWEHLTKQFTDMKNTSLPQIINTEGIWNKAITPRKSFYCRWKIVNSHKESKLDTEDTINHWIYIHGLDRRKLLPNFLSVLQNLSEAAHCNKKRKQTSRDVLRQPRDLQQRAQKHEKGPVVQTATSGNWRDGWNRERRVSENITRPAAAIRQPKQARFWLKKTIYLLYKRSKTMKMSKNENTNRKTDDIQEVVMPNLNKPVPKKF